MTEATDTASAAAAAGTTSATDTTTASWPRPRRCFPDDPYYPDGYTEIDLPPERLLRATFNAEILEPKGEPQPNIIQADEPFTVRFRVALEGELWYCICGDWWFDLGFAPTGKGEGFDLSDLLGRDKFYIRNWRGCDTRCLELVIYVPHPTPSRPSTAAPSISAPPKSSCSAAAGRRRLWASTCSGRSSSTRPTSPTTRSPEGHRARRLIGCHCPPAQPAPRGGLGGSPVDPRGPLRPVVGWAGYRQRTTPEQGRGIVGTEGTRDADDIDRPSEIFPAITTPTGLKRHSRPHRGVDVLPSSSFKTGRFGRMFRHLPVFEQQLPELMQLAERMIAGGGPPPENPDIPSGYTYLGQFIDHDITFDPVSSLQRQNDPDALHNFRTPRFDLDSVYGRGPSDQPYLYDTSGGVTRLKLGEEVGVVPGQQSGAGPDLPRNEPRQRDGQEVFLGRALIGDPRNDENLLVSQLHLTMLQFHNQVIDHVAATTPLTGDNLFKEAQRLVRWHYQWVVVHDFLRRVVGDSVVDDILRTETFTVGAGIQVSITRPRFQFYNPSNDAFMPIEFSVAAYRFGHSMIRGRYHINTFVKNARNDQPIPVFGPEEPPDELKNLNGFRRLPPQWAVEWKFLFPVPGADVQPQPSLLIDSLLAGPLATLPPSVASDPPPSLAARNLQRGLRLGLPAGTTVARAMGITPLTPNQLAIGDISQDLVLHPPLWFYVLKEAEVLEQGRKLGPVGGRIVAEVLLGILANDPLSYLSVEPNFRPAPPLARDDGSFDMAQLIRFAKQP